MPSPGITAMSWICSLMAAHPLALSRAAAVESRGDDEPDAQLRPARGRPARVPGVGDVLPAQVGRVPRRVRLARARGVSHELAADARGRGARAAGEHEV